MNKIGISTLHSYRGAQIFEALGLRKKFVSKYFNNTPSRIEGAGLYVLEKEVSARMEYALNSEKDISSMKTGGDYRWRRDGEAHMLNPFTISKLQQAVREEKYDTYKAYAEKINKQWKHDNISKDLTNMVSRYIIRNKKTLRFSARIDG